MLFLFICFCGKALAGLLIFSFSSTYTKGEGNTKMVNIRIGCFVIFGHDIFERIYFFCVVFGIPITHGR